MKHSELMIWGLVLFLVADWILQNDWMAKNKTNLRHPAAWVHTGIHTAAMLVIFPVAVALALGVSHMLIDTRIPVMWFCKVTRKTLEGGIGLMVLFVNDQVFHIALIALAALYAGGPQ